MKHPAPGSAARLTPLTQPASSTPDAAFAAAGCTALRPRRALTFSLLLSVGLAGPALAGGVADLQTFLTQTQSAQATFEQVVTSPPKSGEAVGRSKRFSGTFAFSRPNRFKFVYKAPFEQSMVSDGQTFWQHDLDLNQVTSRPIGQILSGTPAGLIASADFKALAQQFTFSDLPEKGGLSWVRATPKASDGQLQSLEVGFKRGAAGPELAQFSFADAFGQKSSFTLGAMQVNPGLGAETFRFTPPAGADWIKP